MSGDSYKYWAFISYAHADEAWAGWLHKALEGYRIPERLQGRECPTGTIPKKMFPVFRDRDELAGSASLGPELHKALEGSRALIVICSPRSAQSHWVNEEIKYYKSLGRADRVFALIVDGEPHASASGDAQQECFPQALRFQLAADGSVGEVPAEPIAADARKHGDGRGNAKLKLIAGLLGLGFNDLKQRELQARNRRLGFIAALASGTAALTIVLAVQAYLARNDAQRRQQQAEDLIEFMLGDLRKKLEPIGKLDILDSVGDKAMDYFGTLDQGDWTDPVLTSRATALRQIGEVRLKQGNMPGATEAFSEALELDSELVKRHPKDAGALFNVAESQYSVGYAHYSKGEIEEALPWFEKQAESMVRLTLLEPANSKWQSELSNAYTNLGGVAVYRSDFDAARKYFEAAQEAQASLVARQEKNQQYLLDLGATYGWLTHIELVQRQYEAAVLPARKRVELHRRLIDLAPDNAEYRLQLAGALHQVVYLRLEFQRADPDDAELVEALELTEGLAALDSRNIEYVRAHLVSLSYQEDAYLHAAELDATDRTNVRAQLLAHDLFRRSPGNAQVLDDLLVVLLRSVRLAEHRRDKDTARIIVQEILDLPLSDDERATVRPRRWLELNLLGQWLSGDAEARARYAAQARSWLDRANAAKQPQPPDLMMQFAVLNETPAEAERWSKELTAQQRKHPYTRRFCRDQSCPGIS